MERVAFDDFALANRAVGIDNIDGLPHKFAARDNPSQQGGEKNKEENDGESVRYFLH